MNPTVYIDGNQGTTGLQIVSRLQGRPDIRLLSLPADQRKDVQRRAEALNRCDVAILCLPDDAARQAVAMVSESHVRVIDASSAHRTDPQWVYGLPELCRGQATRIAEAHRISNPGCYPTGALALLRPLVDAGLLPRSHPLAVHAVSGYSGRGRAGVEAYEGRDGSPAVTAPRFQVYGLGLDHKHVPEMQLHAGLSRRPMFVPAYGAYAQGIVLTIPLHLDQLAGGCRAQDLHACLQAHHAEHRHVQVMPLSPPAAIDHLDPEALNGSDDLRLMVFSHDAHGQVLLAAVFDNLGKGAAGAAVQNLDALIGTS
jgi:N-acetyl-gamma-glutamyl-phosphate reductase